MLNFWIFFLYKLPNDFAVKELVSIIFLSLETLPPSSSIKIGYLLSLNNILILLTKLFV